MAEKFEEHFKLKFEGPLENALPTVMETTAQVRFNLPLGSDAKYAELFVNGTAWDVPYPWQEGVPIMAYCKLWVKSKEMQRNHGGMHVFGLYLKLPSADAALSFPCLSNEGKDRPFFPSGSWHWS